MVKETPDAIYPISSEKKAEGWKHFQEYLPLLKEKDLPSQRALPIIHRLVTWGAETQKLTPNVLFDAMAHLIVQDNPSFRTPREFRRALDPIRHYFDQILRTQPEVITMPQIVRMTPLGSSRLPTAVRFQIFMPFRGHLRQYGTRQIAGRPKETIYAPHAKPGAIFREDGMDNVVFVGLTKNLKGLYVELCDKADRLFEQSQGKDLDDRLKAALFLQLWGTSILHPFIDGNGRAFAGKFVIDLNRMGFPLRTMPALPEVHKELAENALAGIGPVFFSHFCHEAGISLPRPEHLSAFYNDSAAVDEYMSKLHDAIREGIRKGIPTEGPLAKDLDNAVVGIKLCLSRDGYIDEEFYNTRIEDIKRWAPEVRQE